MNLKLDDYEVPGHAKNFSLVLPLKDEDASGETSSTTRAKKGNKGKQLEVRLRLKRENSDLLSELARVAEATENGDAKVYTITNDTANAAGMRQGKFSGNFRVDESETYQLWEVSFTLQEHISVPEMAEAREGDKSVTTQSADGDIVGSPSGDSGEDSEDKLSWLERTVLKPINDMLAKNSSDSNPDNKEA